MYVGLRADWVASIYDKSRIEAEKMKFIRKVNAARNSIELEIHVDQNEVYR